MNDGETGEGELWMPKKKGERSSVSDLNLEHVEMTTTVRETLPLPINQNHVPDEDIGSVQRLSFVSSSTGYSSARSSLRSSEFSEESFLSKNSEPPIERRIITQESLLSEARRLKLMKKSNISQFDRIAMELLETERCYVNDLSDVIQGYLNFFIGHREHFQMTVDDVSNTFGCVERIYLFNKRLFCQLDRTLLNVVQMAKCFVDNIDGFKDYVTYCANYQKMVDTLTNLMKNPSIVECLSARQAILGHSLPLSAYLLKPVQRVLKYHLFMENILKQSTENRVLSDADLATVKKALQCLTCLADKINEEKKRVEHWERVRELQSALHSWSLEKRDDLFKYGDLLLEGTFKLAGSKTNRQLFLFEEMLLIVKERNDILICKDYIMCSSIMLNESVNPDPLSFQVMSYDNPKIQYVFIASNLEQKRKWMKELKRMMLDHYDIKIPEKAKLLMLNTDNVVAKQLPISGVAVHETTLTHRSRKVPKYLEKKRKHRDASTPKTSLHRSRRMHMSKGSGADIKPSSSESVVSCPILDLGNSHLSSKCICGVNGTQQKSSFIGKECSSGAVHLDHPNCTPTSFFSNFFQRKRPVEQLISGNKKNAHTPLMLHHSSPCNPVACIPGKRDDELLRCTCSKLEPVVSPISYSSKVSTSSHGDKSDSDNSFVRAYQKLNDSLDQAGVPERSGEKKFLRNHRLSLLEKSLTGKRNKRLEEKNYGTDNDEDGDTDGSDDDQHRCRSKSLSRLDDSHCSSKNESNVLLNGSTFGKQLDQPVRNELQESDRDGTEDQEVSNIISWTESPVIREKIKARRNPGQSTHRRHSSQVAELVWRIKQKQDLKNGQTSRKNEVLLNICNNTQDKLAPSEVLHQPIQDVKLLHLNNRLNEKAVNTKILVSSARQRTPLTLEQQAQLNDMLLEPQLGVVKEMIKQLETQPRSTFRVL